MGSGVMMTVPARMGNARQARLGLTCFDAVRCDTAGVSGLGLFWRDIIRQARNGLGRLRGFWLGKARSDMDYTAATAWFGTDGCDLS